RSQHTPRQALPQALRLHAGGARAPARPLVRAQGSEARRQGGAAARRQVDRAHLREGLDEDALRVRGRRLRPGCPRHLHGALGGAKFGMDVRVAAPKSLWPQASYVELARDVAKETGASVTITDDVEAAVRGCDVLATDVWVSMGEPKEVWAERIDLLLPYQVNAKAMELTGNPGVRFMHCLPAFHNTDTTVGKDIFAEYGLESLEVTEEVFESPASVVSDEAENRMHT